ncbi:MAG: hypothetical protein IPM82_14740 [Saprospiraceae bacterium]|nr:hypothetical protein [Saprospiraceae bacterium]
MDEINMAHLDAASPISSSSRGSAKAVSSGQRHPRRSANEFKKRRTGSPNHGVHSKMKSCELTPATFKPSPSEQIQGGMKVVH